MLPDPFRLARYKMAVGSGYKTTSSGTSVPPHSKPQDRKIRKHPYPGRGDAIFVSLSDIMYYVID